MKENDIVFSMGIDTWHTKDFVTGGPVSRVLVMCFNTPFYCTTVNGMEVGKAGDCVVHAPPFVQYHGTPEDAREGFRNDWLNIRKDLGKKLLDRYNIPVNKLLRTGSPGLITPYLRDIQTERMAHRLYRTEAVTHAVEGLILQIARQYERSVKKKQSYIDQYLHDILTEVRLAMYEHLRHPWTLDELAKLANLSPSHFSASFKRFFGTSPIEDLVSMRIDLAKSRLTEGSASLAQVAEMTGFSDEYYFNRAFKKRVGVPPGKYRRDKAG